jgi:hypothetical protein
MWSFSRAYPTPATDERQVTTTIAVTPITDGARLLAVTVTLTNSLIGNRNPLVASPVYGSHPFAGNSFLFFALNRLTT